MKKPGKVDVYCCVCHGHQQVGPDFNGFMPSHTKTGQNSLCSGTGRKPKLIITPEDRRQLAC